MSVGKAIADIRKRKGMTQAELAEKLGIQQSSINRWENDHVKPRVATLEKIAAILKVPIHELLLGKEGVASSLNINDLELVELLEELPKLDEDQLAALKLIIRDMLTRSQMQRMLSR